MCKGMCLEKCMDMCADIYRHLQACAYACIDTCTDRCVDMGLHMCAACVQCTHVYRCAHRQVRRHVHTGSLSEMFSMPRSCVCTCNTAHVDTRVCAHFRTSSYIYLRVSTHTSALAPYVHMHASMPAHMSARMCARISRHICARMPARMCAGLHAHMPAHKYTRARARHSGTAFLGFWPI